MTAPRVALVIQRYGLEVVGGAELHARMIAEHLHTGLGWSVDVYATTAKSYQTWANEYPAGTEVIGGVRVHRFDSAMQRSPLFGVFNRFAGPLLRRLPRVAPLRWILLLLEWIWIYLQGPVCPALLDALTRDAPSYSKIIFSTYLYYPTIAGIGRFGDQAILIPLAHDELAFHFLTIERMLRRTKTIIANIVPEARLIAPKIVGSDAVIEIAGIGFDEALFQPRPKTSARKYLLYLGRISAGKGVDRLVAWFEALASVPGFEDLELRLAGHHEASVVLPEAGKGARIEYLGFVDEPTKLDLMANALAIVNPSQYESLSMIVVEAMALHVPVLVNARGDVLRYYTESVATAFGFVDEASFRAALLLVLQRDWRAPAQQASLAKSREWALATFSWRHVDAIYERLVLGEARHAAVPHGAQPAPSASR